MPQRRCMISLISMVLEELAFTDLTGHVRYNTLIYERGQNSQIFVIRGLIVSVESASPHIHIKCLSSTAFCIVNGEIYVIVTR